MVENLFSDIKDSMGVVTGIVNNASLFSFDDINSLSKQSWDNHMHVNALVPSVDDIRIASKHAVWLCRIGSQHIRSENFSAQSRLSFLHGF